MADDTLHLKAEITELKARVQGLSDENRRMVQLAAEREYDLEPKRGPGLLSFDFIAWETGDVTLRTRELSTGMQQALTLDNNEAISVASHLLQTALRARSGEGGSFEAFIPQYEPPKDGDADA